MLGHLIASISLIWFWQGANNAAQIFQRIYDAFYDRGSTFPPSSFLNAGAPEPNIVGMPNLF